MVCVGRGRLCPPIPEGTPHKKHEHYANSLQKNENQKIIKKYAKRKNNKKPPVKNAGRRRRRPLRATR